MPIAATSRRLMGYQSTTNITREEKKSHNQCPCDCPARNDMAHNIGPHGTAFNTLEEYAVRKSDSTTTF